MSSELVKLMLKTHDKQGYIEIAPTSLQSYNNPKEVNGVWTDSQEPPYDVDGHKFVDVVGYYNINWFDPSNWDMIKPELSEYFKNIYELVIVNFSRKSIRRNLKNIYTWVFKHRPFKKEHDSWVWVIDSLESYLKSEAEEIAQEQIAKEKGYKDYYDMYLHTRALLSRELVEERAKLISKEEILSKHTVVQVASHMYVQMQDPTILIYDETYLPYALKDGWSDEQLPLIIKDWFKVMHNKDIDVRLRKYNE